jgi:hypothetical protein
MPKGGQPYRSSAVTPVAALRIQACVPNMVPARNGRLAPSVAQ